MMRSLCDAAIACVLLVCVLTIVPLVARGDLGSNASYSSSPTVANASPMTPMPGKLRGSAAGSNLYMAQSGYGRVCRNGNWSCKMNDKGWIGYTCCGCGSCGWWSAS